MTMSKRSEKDTKKKRPREKPLSLFPLTMDEALTEVLQVKPQAVEADKKPKNKNSTN